MGTQLRVTGIPRSTKSTISAGVGVFLCDSQSPSGPPREAPGSSIHPSAADLTSLNRLCSKLIAPLAACVEASVKLQGRAPIQHSDLRNTIERMAHFFLWIFYNTAHEKGRISDDLRRFLSVPSGPKGGTLLDATAGQALKLCNRLARANRAELRPYLKHGINWWNSSVGVLGDVVAVCNEATHLTTDGFDKKIRPLLNKLNQRVKAQVGVRSRANTSSFGWARHPQSLQHCRTTV
jgi:hypothetical protein